MKSNKGITLIALIITIIILLILAGVSISLVVGDNGIMTRAKDAGEKSGIADAKSAFELAVTSVATEYWEDYSNGDVTSAISTYMTEEKIGNELKNGGYTLKSGADFSTTGNCEISNSSGKYSITFNVGSDGVPKIDVVVKITT